MIVLGYIASCFIQLFRMVVLSFQAWFCPFHVVDNDQPENDFDETENVGVSIRRTTRQFTSSRRFQLTSHHRQYHSFASTSSHDDDHHHEGRDNHNDDTTRRMRQHHRRLREPSIVIHPSHSKRSLTQDFQQLSFEDSKDALRLCLFYLLGYIGAAILGFSFWLEPSWTIIDSVYFAIVTLTTTGYGDLTPTTQAGRLFTILFAFYGIVVLGIFLGIIGHALGEMQLNVARVGEQSQQRHFLALFSRSSSSASGGEEEDELQQEHHPRSEQQTTTTTTTTRDKRSLQSEKTRRRRRQQKRLAEEILHVARMESPILLLVLGLAILLGRAGEGWTIIDSVYFCIVSISSIGYGDLVPVQQATRFLVIFLLPIAVAVFGELLGRIASLYIQRKNRRFEKAFFKRSLTLLDVQVMDYNHDGKVTLDEFLRFMLVALQKVDQDELQELMDLFHKLDVTNSGALERADLLEMARRRGSAYFRKYQSAFGDSSGSTLDLTRHQEKEASTRVLSEEEKHDGDVFYETTSLL